MAKILIVEDDVELANFVRSYLEFENHSVEVFHTGSEGRAKLLNLNAQYGLVILDWEIPEVSGIEMLKEYRDKGGDSPVLMLTGKDQSEDKEAGLDTGADDYLTKPFDMKELGARIRALLRRAKAGAPKLPSIGDISLDRDSHRALQNGRSVALTAREYQFLEFLTAHPSETLEPGAYLKQVWNDQPGIDAEILRTTIKRLRKKLDPEGSLICPHLFGQVKDESLPGDAPTGGEVDEDFDLLLGTIINGKYELLEMVGAGGTGLVYKAKHRQLNTMVAVKLLFPHLALNVDMVKRFRREAQTIIGLNHQNILTVHDFGVTVDGQPYLVMELISGGSLSDLIERESKIPVPQALAILQQTCDGLAFAHEHGAIHRDIKPSNIMLIPEGTDALREAQGESYRESYRDSFRVKLVDFGFAKATEQDPRLEQLTKTGEVLGSPPYMSPEQCRGLPVDQRTDIYALGCVIYEMLTGARAFDGKDPIDTIMKQVMQEPPHLVLDEVDAPLRKQLDRITQKCLAKDLKSRYSSVRQVQADLQQLQSEDKQQSSKKSDNVLDKITQWFGRSK